MASGILAADGSTPFHLIDSDDAYVSVNKDFGGGTVAIEKRIEGQVFPLRSSGAAITFTAADDSDYGVPKGLEIRLTLSGSTAPDLVWAIIN